MVLGGESCEEFRVIYDHLLTHNDEFFVLKDFKAYLQAQKRIQELYSDQKKWLSMCITNTAYSGFFSLVIVLLMNIQQVFGT